MSTDPGLDEAKLTWKRRMVLPKRVPTMGRSSNVSVAEGGQLEVEGELTIKGNTHRITARGTVSGPHTDIAGNDKLGVELEAVVDRREYGLEWNAPLPKGGFALENDVKLEVSLELVRQA